MIEVKTLEGVTLPELHRAWCNAFSDYTEPMDMSLQQLQHMIERRGYNPALSFGAYHNDELAGFTLNGTGIWNGKQIAYDTGTGIVKEFRQQGIATRIFNESVPVLKSHGISQYLLEVIRNNTKAFDLYKKMGFEVTREFDYYVSPIEKLCTGKRQVDAAFEVKEMGNPDWDLLKTFRDFIPAWQNSIDAINRKREHFKILGLYRDNELAGYGIIEPATGDIPQLAIAPSYRRKGLATMLFHKLVPYAGIPKIKIINADASCIPFRKFAESLGFVPGYGQYEMMLDL